MSKTDDETGDSKPSSASAAAIGAAAIGSAAVAAALLYVGRRFRKTADTDTSASGMKDTVPSGENPETD